MKPLTVGLYILALLSGVLMWVLPFSAKHDLANINVRLGLALATVYTVLHIIAAGLFIIGLGNFKATLRRPYIIFCTGLITIAVAQLQLPLAVLLDAMWWVTSGALVLLYIAPTVLIYSGIRLFARLVGVKDHWTLFRFAMPVILVPVLISVWLPVNVSPAEPTLQTAHFFLALSLWQMNVNAVCAYLAWRVKKNMGAAYTNAMHWLFITMVAYSLVSAHFIILSYIGYENWYGRNGFLGVLIVLGTMFVIAGYKFSQIGEHESVKENASALDVVIYTAGLATNVSEVDATLDTVRLMTASMAPGRSLAPDDEKALGKVYLELEEYLVEREPLRKLTREGLRESIIERFHPGNQNSSPFWSIISTTKSAPVLLG